MSTWNLCTSAINSAGFLENSWNSITYGNGLFVAVSYSGTGNRVMTSTNGSKWTPRVSATDNTWRCVTFGNNLFVAVSDSGTGNRVMTSSDGITWTTRTSASNNNWQYVCFGNNLFVAVANTGTGNRVMTSSDGITWTSRTSAADNNWNSITYGNGLFVAVGSSGTGNRVMTSSDGITWTSRTSAVDNNWKTVTYGNGLFVAVADSASNADNNRVMISTDGINWTSALGNVFSHRCVTYGNGLFVAVAQSTTGTRVMTSPDGINWTTRNSANDSGWQSVIYANGLFVAVGTPLSGVNVMTSSDGITWKTITSVDDNDWRGVIYGNNVFVAVSSTGTGMRAMTSYDGVNWLYRNTGNNLNDSWQNIHYGNGIFVAVSFQGTIMTSSDGITWSSRSTPANNVWTSVTFGNNLFVAVSSSGTGNRVMTSSDGITWTSRTSAADNSWTSVTFGNNLFVAVSASGTGNRVMTSSDGATWTSRTSAANSNWRNVKFGNNIFVAVGDSGSVMTSSDGINWTSRTGAPSNNWIGLTYGNSLFVAVSSTGSSNRVMTSPDGITWTSRTSAADNVWNSVAYGGGVFVAVPITGSTSSPILSRTLPMYSYSLTKPTISNFSVPSKKSNDTPFQLTSPTSDSNGAFKYISSNESVATIVGNTVTIVGTGTSTIIAVQDSTSTYSIGNITSDLIVESSKITSSITVNSIITKTFGDASFNLNATSNNNETSITYSSSNTGVATVNSSGQVSIVGAGSTTITLSQIETTNYTAGSATVSITVNKATPTISATSSYTKTFGDASFNLNATSNNSETSMTYSSNNTSVATVNSSGQITTMGVGSATITISQVETTNYNTSSTTVSITVSKATPTITATTSYTKTFGDASFNLNATSNNLETSITYSSSNTSIATVNSSGQVSIVGAGTATITLSQSATTNYNAGSATVSITINKATPTITAITPVTKTFGDASFNLNATSNNTETSITYSSSNTNVATVNSSGQVSIVGSGSAIITLSQIETTNYNSTSSTTVSITVNKATPTISATSSYTKTFGDASFNLNATSNNSETSITYSSSNTNVATVNSNGQVTIVSTGSAILTLSQIETSNFNLTSKDVSITVSKATPTINITTPIVKVYGDASFNLNASSNNNETSISYSIDDTNEVQLDSNGQVNIVGTGSSTITVSQIETANYNARSEFISITVNKAITSINAASSYTKTFGDASFNINPTSNNTETSISYSSNNTNVVTVNSSGQVTIVGAGTATITLQQTETNNYSSGTKNISMTVNKLTSTISSSSPISKSYGDNSFNLEFTSNNPETTYFTSTDTSIASIDASGNITLIKPGTTKITISKLSTNNYTDETINITLNISKTYTASQLKDLGFTATEMKNAGYTATELKSATFTATELKAVEYSLNELVLAGYNATQLKTAQFTATQLKAAEFTATELKAAQFTATELKTAQFTATELKTAQFTASELKTAQFTASELKTAQFTATELKTAQFTASELKTAQFTATELKSAQFTASELKIAQFTVSELKNVNYLDSEILLAGFTGSELRTSGYNISELKANGYTNEEILASGYPTADLYVAGYNINQIKNTGYTDTQILTDLNTVLSIIPYPPVITSIQSDDSKAYVSFTDNSNNSIPILGYKYSLNNSSDLKWFFTKQSPLSIFGLTNGQSYSISMYAVNMNGTSSVSNTISNIIPSSVPSKPTIAIASITNNKINAAFTAGNSNGSPITEYYYSLDQINYLLIEPSGNTFTINDVVLNQSYTLSMKTKNAKGFSEPSNTIIVSNPILPNPPVITSIQSDDSKVYVSFTDNSNNLIPILGYKYSLNNSSDLKWFLTKQSPLSIFGLTNGQNYSIGMYSVNMNGTSSVSNIISNIMPSGIPNKPILISANLSGQTLTAEFASIVSNGSAITEHYYSLDQTTYTLIEPSGNLLIIGNIQYNRNYLLSMKVKNTNGFSPISNTLNINSSIIPSAPTITNIIPGNKECLIYFNQGETYNSNLICYKYFINDSTTEYISSSKTSPFTINSLINGNSYKFKIKAITTSGESPLSIESNNVIPYGEPLAPVITKIEPRNQSIIVNFTSNNNNLPISGFKYAINNFEFVDIGMVTSPFTITNLINKTMYAITFYSYNNIGTSIRSNTISCISGAPTAPTINSTYISNKILYINYTPSEYNNGFFVTRMFYTIDNGKTYLPIDKITNPLVISKLTVGINFNLAIVSSNINGISPMSNIVENLIITDIPNKPAILSVTPLYESATTFQASVVLSPVVSNGSAIIGYKYALGSTSTTYMDVSGISLPLIIPGLPVNTSLVIKIKAVNSVGESQESIVSKSFIYNMSNPARVIIRSITTSFELATVFFNKPLTGGSEIIKYKYSLNGLNYIDLNTTTLPLLIPIQNNINYNIQIIATNEIGDSTPSAPLTTLVRYIYLSPLPPKITSIIPWNNSLIVNFTPPTLRGAPVTSYSYAVDSSQNIVNSNITTSPITIDGLTNGTKYNIMLYANSLAGTSTISNIVSGTPILSSPGIPIITNITPLNNSCSVAFTPPLLANGSAITTYMYSLDNGITLINANTITSPFLISGLVNGTTYNVRILAVNSIGNSQLSTAKTVTPIYTVPTAPAITSVSRSSGGRVTVNFTLSIPNGSTISSYYYTFDNGVTYINANKTTSPIILTGLNVGTTYSIRLAALNNLGYSPLSTSSTFTAI